MAQVQFPIEVQMGPTLKEAPLDTVRAMVEKLSRKTGDAALPVLESAMQRLDEIEAREIALNGRISDLHKELCDLQISMNRLEPLEIAQKLDLLREKIFECPEPSTELLKKSLQSLKERFDHLLFLYVFPDTEELNPNSFQNTLLFRCEQKVSRSDEKTAASLKKTLLALQLQCDAAEEIFQGKGFSTYLSLPEEVREDVEGRLFEKHPQRSLEEIVRLPDGPLFFASAVMASLGDRMMDVDL